MATLTQTEITEHLVRVDAGAVLLDADLRLPEGARGIVLFAHGSGSSRFSPRNRQVASPLNHNGLGTLLIDLLTPDEERRDNLNGGLRFDIDLLAQRLALATDWISQKREARGLPVGYFGASTGAAAALVAAAARGNVIRAVVSRGGRPDLACDALARVLAPTLLIVGGRDAQVIQLNRTAFAALRCDRELVIIPGATHLFEEAGALDEVARLACAWFVRHLTD
jgi:putative phosphoribosyl transferase